MMMRDREIENREKANDQAQVTPSCSAKSRARVAPGEKEQSNRQDTAEEGSRPTLSEEEKRNFGMELRNGVGEKQYSQQSNLATSPRWGEADSKENELKTEETNTSEKNPSPAVSEKSVVENNVGSPETGGAQSSKEASPGPEAKTKDKRRKKNRGRNKTLPPGDNLTRIIKVIEKTFLHRVHSRSNEIASN